MRHRRTSNRLKQKPGHARMVKRNLLTSLLLYESIRTTKRRAAVIAPEIDKMITFAKKNTPHVAIRHLNKTLTDKNACKKVMEVFIKRYAKRNSGLTRIKAVGYRGGDGAEVVDVSLLEGEPVTLPEKPEKPKKTVTQKKTEKSSDSRDSQDSKKTSQKSTTDNK